MFSYIYLASQSPRRQELLKQIGVQFEMLIASAEEDTESLEISLSNEKADDYVQRVALAKSAIALERWKSSGKPWAPILCADTTVSLPNCPDGAILGKPIDAKDAVRILRMLSAKTHEVLTAVVLITDPVSEPLHLVQVSKVQFCPLTEEQISRYIASGEPFGKAGAYGIQGFGGAFISSIQGSYSGIMGLPIFEVHQLLDLAKVARI
ncbi:Maf family protein [Polynucleobacter brandtiae]|uniref:dTTP/UTP pyrophosphatase n=1 Tax=Polynucleobacter brandtiae TaxID=1938816 RepID=A0A2M8VJ95_9BURK|nr:Maf family protein [Polynucleobacter brandtiae]PJI77074.1 septum formation protein [Polynucleobacter brandtiae]